MLETTSSINLFIPMMIGILASKAVTDLLSRSLYERALRSKQMPVLAEEPPK
jgi:H+/Cl- antiporter ClcA